jgi:hypothetical protein
LHAFGHRRAIQFSEKKIHSQFLRGAKMQNKEHIWIIF